MDAALFRKAAIERVSSPEQIDLMMKVTSPLGWLGAATIGGMLFIIGVWSVFGSIPELADGQGVLLRGERLLEVKTAYRGTVTRVTVTPDTEIKAGQVVAVVERDRAEIEQKIALKEEALHRLEAQHAGENSTDQINIGRNEAMIGAKRKDLQSLRRQRQVQEDLVNRGLKAGNVLLDLDRSIHNVEGELTSLLNETAILRTRMAPRTNEEKNLLAEIAFLKGELERTFTEIKTPDSGRVFEVIKVIGDKVAEGEPLVRLEVAKNEEANEVARDFCGGRTHAVVYIPGESAGKVRPGNVARVSPADVKKEEYGYILGRVEWMANYAASPDEMKEKLKNERLVQSYNEKGPVYEARVCLTEDPTNKANGYKWSSSRGPEKKIGNGTLCTANMVVGKRRPYTFVIPAVKRTLGI